ncbi:MAG: nicotinate (nicotinamide) nucleotide adenylyltransferase [Acidobacteriia bacterium]|nr:nicotinate (nicotinamide) nucleotide adenylyltransferase [Terriglobia bacterium]
MRLAIFGGTFDPVHKAHVAMAREAADRFHLDRVLFVPSSNPPHKPAGTYASFEDRIRMAELAISGDARLEVSRLEQGRGPNYSADTIEKVRESLAPGDELFFLIGADAFAEIETWHRWRDVARAVEFIVVSRPGHQYRTPPNTRVERLETLDLPVSSSEIRTSLALGQRSPEIPEPVLSFISERGLYGVPVPAKE